MHQEGIERDANYEQTFAWKKKDKKTHGESKNKQNKTENNDNKKLHFLVKLETWGHIGKFPNELVVLR